MQQRLMEFCQENTLVIASTLSNKSRYESMHDYHQIVNTKIRLIIFFVAKDEETLYGQAKPELELSVSQIISSLLQNSGLELKIGESTRPFRYDVNQIYYDYTVDVMNRFNGLDLVDRVPEELWMEVCNILQVAGPVDAWCWSCSCMALE